MDQSLVNMMRVLIPAQVVKGSASIQQIQLSVDDVEAEYEWLRQSQVNRDANPTTEETLNS